MIGELVKQGICSTVDFASGTITATFPDRQDSVSGDLPVFMQGGYGAVNKLPKVGDTVVCLFMGNGVSKGHCLGIVPDDIPGTLQQEGTYFEDGSYVYYDSSTQQLVVKALSKVIIDGDLEVTGTVTQGGGD